ncbi:MAG: hydrogenase [Planctomycetes bacterium]|nr:hydrogenase [Planctomycetota bacterium]
MPNLLLLIHVPLAFALLCLGLPFSWLRLASLAAGAVVHLGVVAWTWWVPSVGGTGAYLGLDPLGHLFLTLISVLFAATSVYFVGYHQKRLVSQRVFLACVLVLLAALSLVCLSRQIGLLWVAMEAASLAATPLIYFRLGPRALEATWKFVLMNSVGIALALLGIFCIAVSAGASEGGAVSLTVSDLIAGAARLDPVWLRAGFLLALVGFGTKMGLAPLHSWKPDAYGEAPPPVAALLAGGMTLGAFTGILRVYQICNAAGLAAFAGFWLMVFGLLSLAVAAVFIVGHNDYRRILAYTSVEHMGIMAVGIGLGASGSYATMLHALHNTLNKGVLFFLAGFVWRTYHSTRIRDVAGMLHRFPAAGVVLLAGLCATCALPPFGMFFSELGVLLAAAEQSRWWVVGVFTFTLAVVFVGVMTAMLPMVFGDPPVAAAGEAVGPRWRRTAMLAPAGVLALLALALGTYQPRAVTEALAAAAACVSAPGASERVAVQDPVEVLP